MSLQNKKQLAELQKLTAALKSSNEDRSRLKVEFSELKTEANKQVASLRN